MDVDLLSELKPKRRTVRCPNCASTNTAKILYGMPDLTDELEEKLEAGKVCLGGCDVFEDSPIRHCNECDKDY